MTTIRATVNTRLLSKATTLRLDRRELVTILGALRFHQDENLHIGGEIPDLVVRTIATDGGKLKPLDRAEAQKLSQRLKKSKAAGLLIDPPQRERGEEPLYRVVYIVDVNSADAHGAAEQAHQLLSHPESMAPVLQVIDHRGTTVTIDLGTT